MADKQKQKTILLWALVSLVSLAVIVFWFINFRVRISRQEPEPIISQPINNEFEMVKEQINNTVKALNKNISEFNNKQNQERFQEEILLEIASSSPFEELNDNSASSSELEVR